LAHPPPLVGAGWGGGSRGPRRLSNSRWLIAQGGATPLLSPLPQGGRRRGATICVDSKAEGSLKPGDQFPQERAQRFLLGLGQRQQEPLFVGDMAADRLVDQALARLREYDQLCRDGPWGRGGGSRVRPAPELNPVDPFLTFADFPPSQSRRRLSTFTGHSRSQRARSVGEGRGSNRPIADRQTHTAYFRPARRKPSI
jgi:hypothetical protein